MPRLIVSGPDPARAGGPSASRGAPDCAAHSGHRPTSARGTRRWAPLAAALIALGPGWPALGIAEVGHEAAPRGGAQGAAVAVARPNLRAGVEYGYAHVDATRTTVTGSGGTQTLRLGAESGNSVVAGLVATVPVVSIVGLRATVHGGFDEARRSLDALEPGESTIDGYGGLVEVLVRDPRLGAFTVGGGYDRLEGDGGVSADQLTGRAEAQVFFPDLGSGPVDWFVRFEFRHRQVAGSGQGFDVDADVYHVGGGARWYVAPDVAVVLAGRWQRSEEEFFAEDDTTGELGLHWRLPVVVGPSSLELFASGFAGASEYKEPPYRGDQRLLYGARAGLTIRLFSGTSLLDSIRRFD